MLNRKDSPASKPVPHHLSHHPMLPKRIGAEESHRELDPSAYLALGGAHRAHESAPHTPAGEDRISLFWRVFGGTILSILALGGVTVYNNLASNIFDVRAENSRVLTELRAEVSRLNETRVEAIKKDEFGTRMQEVQTALQQGNLAATSMKEQVQSLNERQLSGLKEMKESQEALRVALAALRDKLTSAESGMKVTESDHRLLQQVSEALGQVKEKAASRDAVIKTFEDERKDLTKEIQLLSERIAKLEGVQESKPPTKEAAAKPSSR